MNHEGLMQLQYWLKYRQGRALLFFWVATFASVTSYSVAYRESNKKNIKQEIGINGVSGNSSESKRNVNGDNVLKGDSEKTKSSWLSVVLKKMFKEKQVFSRGCLLSLALCLRLWVSINVSKQIGTMGSLLAQRKWKELAVSQMKYAMWTIPGAFLNSFVDFSVSSLALSIRASLVKKVHKQFASESSLIELTQNVSDPEQRITNDIDKLSQDIAVIYQSVFKPLAETVMLSVTLANLMGKKELLMCYGYFAFAGTWSRYVTPSLTNLSKKLQAEEGRFRASHARVKSYAEEIHFNRGEAAESALLNREFAHLELSTLKSSFQKLLSSSLDGYVVRYMGILAALRMMMPALDKKNIKDPTEFFLTCLHLLVNLMTAFKDIAVGFRTLGDARGLAARVEELFSTMGSRSPPTGVSCENDDCIEMKDLTVGPPGSDLILFSNLNLKIKKGESVFIQGENGVGKTSILRILAGIWRPKHGSVNVPRDCMFLPARPYILPNCTLREQVLYPNLDAQIDDKIILDALVQVGLVSPKDMHILGTKWKSDSLSSGEMQRLACARLLVVKPSFACLDECTSFCTEEFERNFFETCIKELGVTLLTISHRRVTCDLHNRIIQLRQNGIDQIK